MKRWLGISRLSLRSHKVDTGAGYTITEVMIVLLVTTAVFASAAIALSGRQARAEFTQAVRSFEAQLQTTISEVANGAYSSETACTAAGNAGAPSLGGANTPGSCIFVGKVYDLSGGNSRVSSIATMLGRRTHQQSGASQDVTTLTQAAPALLPDRETFTHPFQLSLEKAVLPGGASVPAFGFVVPLAGSGSLAPNQAAGSQQVLLYALDPGEALTVSGSVLNVSEFTPLTQGLKLCLRGTNGQWAELDIGTGATSNSLLYSTLDTPHTGVCSG